MFPVSKATWYYVACTHLREAQRPEYLGGQAIIFKEIIRAHGGFPRLFSHIQLGGGGITTPPTFVYLMHGAERDVGGNSQALSRESLELFGKL